MFRLLITGPEKESVWRLPASFDQAKAERWARSTAIYTAKPVTVRVQRGPEWADVWAVRVDWIDPPRV